jgi:hypothetical protein
MSGGLENAPIRQQRLAQMCAGRTGWTREVVLGGAEHLTFTDLEYLPRTAGTVPISSILLGTIAPDRAQAAISAYVTAMFDHFLRGRPAPLLDTHPTVPRDHLYRLTLTIRHGVGRDEFAPLEIAWR